MKICPKCNTKNKLFTKKNHTQTGLYCGECGSWIKWLSKQEVIKFEYESNNAIYSRTDVRNAIEDLRDFDSYNPFQEAIDKVLEMFDKMG